MDGDNKLTCDSAICQGVKTDSKKGVRIGKLPPVITLCLYRFELDYETWQRKKLDDKFEYPLELDMAKYMGENALQDDTNYELKSIVIHRGGAYGGHYLAYIKDDLSEGNWYLEKHEEYSKEPEEVITKKFDPKDFMTNEEKEKLEDEKNKNNPNYKKEGQGSKKKNKNKKNVPDKKDKIDLDFSKCDFPIPYSEQRLVEDWYEFNDSTITPIHPGLLQSKFGGNT